MAATRTSSRQAAQKAKEAMAAAPVTKPRSSSAGAKRKERKASAGQEPAPKKEKKNEPNVAVKKKPKKGEAHKPVPEPHEEQKETKAEPGAEDKKSATVKPSIAGGKDSHAQADAPAPNILEKGVIYFFYRARVNVTEPHDISDIARSFVVLRPIAPGTHLDQKHGPLEAGSQCRLLMIPKKRFPTSGREREMGIVEKAGKSVQEVQESLGAEEYQTKTHGESHVPEATPYAEGVYAITRNKRDSRLAYVLTIPESPGSLHEEFGVRARGSWTVQARNPKYPAPPSARIPGDPHYPEKVQEIFGDYRWVPLSTELLDYANAQFLLIGHTLHDPTKAVPEEPGPELEKMEEENEGRVEEERGDETIYEDLGLNEHAHHYPKVPTTWNGS